MPCGLASGELQQTLPEEMVSSALRGLGHSPDRGNLDHDLPSDRLQHRKTDFSRHLAIRVFQTRMHRPQRRHCIPERPEPYCRLHMLGTSSHPNGATVPRVDSGISPRC